MKKLIIAEKPSLGKKIAEALGIRSRNKNGNFEDSDIIIQSLVGHVIEAKYEQVPWSLETLPLSLENPITAASKGKEKIVSQLGKELKRSDISEIVNAGDADTEGSLLVYELYEHFGILDKSMVFSRMWILAEDKKTIKKAYEERYSQDEDMKFVNTGKSRALADVRLGFNFSRLFTLKGCQRGTTYAIGRVMTPTMQIIRNRELEIEGFVPEDYWTIKGLFSKDENTFDGDNFHINSEGKQSTTLNKEDFDDLKKKIDSVGDQYKVSEKTIKVNNKKPDLLPNLNDILKSMSKLHKITPKKTTAIMQFLYENQFCTYPRSESKFLPTSMEDDVREVFDFYEDALEGQLSGENLNFNIRNKKIFDDTKVGSHFAIIPMVKYESDIKKLDNDHRNVFDYICSKFLMAFMDDYIYESTVIVIENQGVKFKVTGKIEKSKGFKNYACASNGKDSKDSIVPDISEGDEVLLKKIKTKKSKTTPPPVITSLSLLEIMENVHKLYQKEADEDEDLEFDGSFSLGTPATRGAIIEKLLTTRYIARSGQKLIVTDLGVALLNTVKDAIDIKTTAEFEEEMSKILKGDKDPQEFDKKINLYVDEIIKRESKGIRDAQAAQAEKMKTGISCPVCSVGSINSLEKSYRCSEAGMWDPKKKTFSGCQFGVIKYMSRLKHEITQDELEKMIAGESLDVSGTKLVFDMTSKYYVKIEQPTIDVDCPLCSSGVVDTGKSYRCSEAGTWDPKKKKFSGCQFGVIKHMSRLNHTISEGELSDLISGSEVSVGDTSLVYDESSSYFIKVKMPSIGIDCPLCSSELVDMGKSYRCSEAGSWDPKKKKFTGCQFNLSKHLKPLKWDISIESLKNILSGEVIEVEKSKVSFDKNNSFFIKIDFGNNTSELDIECPSCSGKFIESEKVFRCKNTGSWDPKKKKMNGKCKVTIFKDNKFFGRTLTVEDLDVLAKGEAIENNGKKMRIDLKSKYITVVE
jgi:DNA topoisomerase-3